MVLPYFCSVDVKFCTYNVLPICLHPKRLLSYFFFMTHTRLNVFNLTFRNSHPSLSAEVLNTLQVLLCTPWHIPKWILWIHFAFISYIHLVIILCLLFMYFDVFAPQLDPPGKERLGFPPSCIHSAPHHEINITQ